MTAAQPLPAAAPRLPYPAAVVGVWLAVGLLLTLCDRFFHVSFGVLAYSNPTWTGQAWWVFPGFVGAAASMYLSAKALFLRHCRRPATRELVASVALFVAAYAASGLFLAWPRALLVGYVLAWLLRVALGRDRGATLVFGLVLAVIGCLVEGLLTLTGDVAYSAPEIFHVPWWLAGLYLHGAFVVLQVVRRVEEHYGRA